MVDPQAAGAGDRGADRLDERLVVGVAQPPRDQRRGAPVLALGVEGVRRGADADALGEHVLPGPGVRAAAGDADRQVLDDGHVAGGGGELQVQRPLQPGVEGDDGAVLLDVAGELRALGTAQLLGPGVPVAAVLLGDRGPGRPVLQRSAPAPPASGRTPRRRRGRRRSASAPRACGPRSRRGRSAVRPTAPGRRRPRGRRRRRRAPRRPAGRSGCGSGGWPAGRGWPPARRSGRRRAAG